MTLKLMGVYIFRYVCAWNDPVIEIRIIPLYAYRCFRCERYKFSTCVPKKQRAFTRHINGSEIFGMTEKNLDYLTMEVNTKSLREFFLNIQYDIPYAIVIPTIHAASSSECMCENSIEQKRQSVSMKEINKFFIDVFINAFHEEYNTYRRLINCMRSYGENILESPIFKSTLEAIWDELILSGDRDDKKYRRFVCNVVKPLEDELGLFSCEVCKVLPGGFRDLICYIVDYSSEIKVFIETIIQIHQDAKDIGPRLKKFLDKIR
ncbi:MAG: hypothetical protein Hyperionvirus4_58 [Hyperionvirus sp.]|uniref:Uncharacterized protein n=1 Tax=Hyperionvirus sp. TaxID=2487770 RepID=A0A3G5AB79_9VIRU|nr:MAG: hypothetical protein Hyperionvirus4_58 [Hyperionvirus sp.]